VTLRYLIGVDLAEICITSNYEVREGEAPADAFRLDGVPDIAVVVEKAVGTKCARSWKILPTVGENWSNRNSNEIHDLLPSVTITRRESVDIEPYRAIFTTDPATLYSLNSLAGVRTSGNGRELFELKKLSELTDPAPGNALTFLHEHDSSIEDGSFCVEFPGSPYWCNFPATLHQGGDNVSFADGHVDHWRWLEPNTFKVSRQKAWINFAPAVLNDRDLIRLQRATFPKIMFRND
jgi:prepilin-type processing-associated H-X9-DG protein